MTDLWADERASRRTAVEPLAVRLRPRTLEDVVGQDHFLGPGQLLRRMLEADRLTSVIFWGPPGTGKTTLAEVIAAHTGRRFERAHAARAGVKDVRGVLDRARAELEHDGRRTILFLDEIHRFARNQQDVLLADVEHGVITLIGATTENPHFTVNGPLLSRSTLFQFHALGDADISTVLRRAVRDERGFGHMDVRIDDDAIAHWARICDGDARRALTALEVAVLSAGVGEDTSAVHIDLAAAEQSIQAKALQYDGTGDEHYDVVSAFIKSMRGSDPDATIYWLARMLEAGEDPRFIARRIAILASEDIGNADPNAMTVAASTWTIIERVGMPEGQLTLAQAAIYMAAAPKSNASAQAIWSAARDVREGRTVPVPTHLKSAHSPSVGAGARSMGHGQDYASPHDATDGYVLQDYLGVDRVYYRPTARGLEAEIRQRLENLRTASRERRKSQAGGTDDPQETEPTDGRNRPPIQG